MKFGLAIEKKNKASAGRAEGHNNRHHPTKSQLPKSAWFTPQGHQEVTPWRSDVLDAAKALAKRKDAVVAIELVIQVGNQSDWRTMPTAEHPHGKPKPNLQKKFEALMAGAKAAVVREFGAQNIVGIDFHTDESSPHIHVVVTPVFEGKLQQKHWLDGAEACARLRERIHKTVSHQIKCDYTKGVRGGAPHDPAKAAGGPKAPQPQPSLLKRAMGAFDAFEEVRQLKAKQAALEAKQASLFSEQKRLRLKAESLVKETAQSKAEARSADKRAKKLQGRVDELEQLVEQLRPKIPDLAPAPAPTSKAELNS